MGDDEILYLYSPSIPHRQWTVIDQETSEVRITLAALKWDNDGISCYRQQVFAAYGMSWKDVKREPKNGVFSLRVLDIRAKRLGVAFDPNPDVEHPHPRDVAHTLIVDGGLSKRENKDAREELAAEAVIVHLGDPTTSTS